MYKTQLEHIFQNEQFIFTGDEYYLLPIDRSAFFCINPVKNLDNRQLENLSNLQNFLIEFDEASYEQQFKSIAQIEASGLNIASAVFSGSKSIHLIFSMAETLQLDYKTAWLALASEVRSITGLTADAQCKNANRLSRLAGFVRPDTGKVQELLHLGGFIKNDKLMELVDRHKIKHAVTQTTVSQDPTMSVEKFELILIKRQNGLYSKIARVDEWAGSVGMYKELFNITCWAIDATGVPESTFKQFAQNKIFPALLEAGYPINKLDKPIDNAYTYKT
jgi:hypothetical protein